MNKFWKIASLWNEALETRPEREVKPREVIWASELGKSDVDLFLKLKGEPPSNDFDARSLRKFEAGNLFEWVIKIIFVRSGIFKEEQKWVANEEFGLRVVGKLDYLAGGEVDLENSINHLKALELPNFFMRCAEKVLSDYALNRPNKNVQGFEVKSTSSWGIEKVYETNAALAGHDIQTFHYAYGEKLPFMIVYICRDDLRLAEIPVSHDDEGLLGLYSAKIRRVSDYYLRNEMPPLEKEILFEKNKFSKNFNVEYSSYLTKLYGYQSPSEYDEAVSSKIESWNRVLTRFKNGDKITDNNKEKLEEMKSAGFDVDKIIAEITG